VVAARAYHYGIGHLSAILKAEGHQTSLLHLSRFRAGRVDRALIRFRPDLVAVSSTSDQFPLAARVVERVRRLHGPPVVLGGVQATMAPEETLSIPGLLGICLGEADRSLPALVSALAAGREPWETPNFWFRRDGEIVRNPLGPLVEDLDSLPFPDREVFQYQSLVSLTGKASFCTGRGCPYLCPYCANHALKKIYRGCGAYVRQRGPARVVDEVVEVLGGHRGIRQVVFEDETFTHDRRWIREFCAEYARRVDRPFACSTRFDRLDEELVGLLKGAGCFQLRLGIESGNEALRRRVLRKEISNSEVLRICGLVRGAGISLWTFNMIGLPGETEQNVRETIRLNREVRPETPFVSVFRPYPGTELERECRDKGWISNRRVHSFFQNVSLLDQPSISARRVAYYHNIFPWEVSYPRLAFIPRALSKVFIPGTATRSLYDLVSPVALYAYKAKRYLTGR